MNDNDKIPCKHKYVVGYSFRMPQLFFRSLPCDSCGCSIRLSFLWRIAYWFVSFIGLIFAYNVSMSIQIKLFGSTLFVSIFVFYCSCGLFSLRIGLFWSMANGLRRIKITKSPRNREYACNTILILPSYHLAWLWMGRLKWRKSENFSVRFHRLRIRYLYWNVEVYALFLICFIVENLPQ